MKGRPLIDVLFEDDMAQQRKKALRRGGRRIGAGRPAPEGRGKSYSVYLTPPEQRKCLAAGVTVQEGLRRLIRGK